MQTRVVSYPSHTQEEKWPGYEAKTREAPKDSSCMTVFVTGVCYNPSLQNYSWSTIGNLSWWAVTV